MSYGAHRLSVALWLALAFAACTVNQGGLGGAGGSTGVAGHASGGSTGSAGSGASGQAGGAGATSATAGANGSAGANGFAGGGGDAGGAAGAAGQPDPGAAGSGGAAGGDAGASGGAGQPGGGGAGASGGDGGGAGAGTAGSGAAGAAGGGGTSCQQAAAIDRACGSDGDCVAVKHVTDCCGNVAWLGIRKSERPRFTPLEAACAASYPACGCAPHSPVADDGSAVPAGEMVSVKCQSGACETFAAACGKPCEAGRTCLACAVTTTPRAVCTLRCADASACTEPYISQCRSTFMGGVCSPPSIVCSP